MVTATVHRRDEHRSTRRHGNDDRCCRSARAPTCQRTRSARSPLVAIAASSCGIPLDTAAKPVSSAQAGLLAGTPQVPGSSFKPGSTPFEVYFIRDGNLYPVRRYIYSSTLSRRGAVSDRRARSA